MLAEFQQAMADLVASPELCALALADGDELRRRYDLDDREHNRLVAMVAHRGMASNCMLYRANRLAPVVLNLPGVCAALGPALRSLLTDYWVASPTTDVHFLVEADRFRRFVLDALEAGRLPGDVADLDALGEALDREGHALTLHLEASRHIRSVSGERPVAAREQTVLPADVRDRR